MSDTQGRAEAEPVREPQEVEDPATIGARAVVDTDIGISLYGVEADTDAGVGTINGLTERQIRAGINGMAVYVQGHKFVLALDNEPDPDRFFFPEELSGEAVAVMPYIDGRSLMVLARWGKAVADTPLYGTRSIAPTRAERVELEAAVVNVKLAMEGVAIEVRGGR